MKKNYLILSTIFFLVFAAGLSADSIPFASKGQTVYVPAYSHIYIGNTQTPYLLAVTLSIRNISPTTPITITEASYYNSQGKFLKHLIQNPAQINSLSSSSFFIGRDDTDGGAGACFIVRWESTVKTNPPIIEAVMIGTQSQQGISFTSRSEVILKRE